MAPMDLNTVVTSTGGVDYTWLASRHGTNNALTRTLDVSTFTSGTHYDATTKVIPSGVVLAKITASGLYGPYDTGATDGRQSAVDSILLDPVPLLLPNGALSTQVGVAAIRHAIIRAANLPVTAHRSITSATAGAGGFVFES